MKKLLISLTLITSLSAYAEDDEFDCHKNRDHIVECKAKKDGVAVQSIELNGGGCESVVDTHIHHKIMKNGEKFIVPGSKECGYVAGLTLHTHSGKIQLFRAM